MGETLSAAQSAALLDILSHHDTYDEIRDFRIPGILKHYGPPFTSEKGTPSDSPALQTLVSRFLLNLPGLKDLSDDFWTVQCRDIIENLEQADLSESYDKGIVGSRKTLATAISALVEYPVRGTYGGFAKVQDRGEQYDLTNAEDLSRSFRDFLTEAVYGTVFDDLVEKTAKTDQLLDHTLLVQAVHEYVLVNIASLMHYTLILSPKGQYLLKLIDNANKLVPYLVIKQTLKIGNVASMLSAMMKVVLAKMSVTSLTNWIGLTQTADEGMNLMQQIIATVLNWDIRDLESRASKLEKDRSAPSKEQLAELKAYPAKSRDEHELIRKQSQSDHISIVSSILRFGKPSSELSESQHAIALDYVAIQLSIADRKSIIQVFCHSQPDHLTQSVRQIVSAYEPVIRHVHNAVDLSETVGDLEAFVKDTIKLSKILPSGKDGKIVVPTVGDFVQLIKKHQGACHKFIHQCCKNGKEVTGWYLAWAKTAASHFKRETESSPKDDNEEEKDAGALTAPLNELFSNLPPASQTQILPILDLQILFLDEMHAASLRRLDAVLKSPASKNPAITRILTSSSSRSSSRGPSRTQSPARSVINSPTEESQSPRGDKAEKESDAGPGAYLARWADLLDATAITPLTATGDVLGATSKEIILNSARDVDGQAVPVPILSQDKIQNGSGKPDVGVVVEALGSEFRTLLARRGCYW